MLNSFFASPRDSAAFVRGVSDRGFDQARSRVHMPVLSWLKDWLLGRADAWVPRLTCSPPAVPT